MKIFLCDSAVLQVKDPLECSVGEQIDLLYVSAAQWN